MILLTGNIGEFLQGLLVIAFFIFLPFALGLWYLVSKIKFYQEIMDKGTPSTRIILLSGTFALTILLFIGTIYCVYKTIVTD